MCGGVTYHKVKKDISMTTKILTAFKVVLAVLTFVSIMLLAGWLDAPEIEAHEQWYAEQAQRTWCL